MSGKVKQHCFLDGGASLLGMVESYAEGRFHMPSSTARLSELMISNCKKNLNLPCREVVLFHIQKGLFCNMVREAASSNVGSFHRGRGAFFSKLLT